MDDELGPQRAAALLAAVVKAGASRQVAAAVASALWRLESEVQGEGVCRGSRRRTMRLQDAVLVHKALAQAGIQRHNLGLAVLTAKQEGLLAGEPFAAAQRVRKRANDARHAPWEQEKQSANVCQSTTEPTRYNLDAQDTCWDEEEYCPEWPAEQSPACLGALRAVRSVSTPSGSVPAAPMAGEEVLPDTSVADEVLDEIIAVSTGAEAVTESAQYEPATAT